MCWKVLAETAQFQNCFHLDRNTNANPALARANCENGDLKPSISTRDPYSRPMTRRLAFVSTLLLGSAGAAQQTDNRPAQMTAIVVRLTGTGIKPYSYAALPKKIFVANPHYARIE